MITSDTTRNLHSKFSTLTAEADLVADRNLQDLLMFAIDNPAIIDFDGDHLTFPQADAPLHRIAIERILGAENLPTLWAIIIPAGVIFVDKRTGHTAISFVD